MSMMDGAAGIQLLAALTLSLIAACAVAVLAATGARWRDPEMFVPVLFAALGGTVALASHLL